MTKKEVPCEECVLLAMCISQRNITCDIIWSYYSNSDTAHRYTTYKKIIKTFPNMGVLRRPPDYSGEDKLYDE